MKLFIHILTFACLAGHAVFAETQRQDIDRLTPNEVKATWEKLNNLIAKSGGIDPIELDRARLQGVLERLGRNARLVETKPTDTIAQGVGFKSEMLPRSVFYTRLGDLSADNISQLEAAIRKEAKAKAILLDLRATRGQADYEAAAHLAGLFAGGGKTYFSMTGNGGSVKNFSWQGDLLYNGIVIILVNEDTNGPAEAVAAALRQQIHALIVGKNTSGRALDFVAMPVNEATSLEVAVGRIVLPGAAGDYLQNGVEPDLVVPSDLAVDREILLRSEKQSMGEFIFEIERPHMNEASLVAGKNPELDEYEQRKADENKKSDPLLMDHALQRALDAATSLLVLSGPVKTDN